MRARILACLLILTIFGSIFVSPIYSQVVINEFCSNCTPEWVELYNLSPNPVDLDGWSFLFGSPNQSLVISNTNYPNNRTIGSSDFFLVTLQSNWLNNSGDTIQLFNQSSANPLDETSYSGTITSENTYSRIPDGIGDFVANTTGTPEEHNQSPTPTPIPTSTITPTPTQTATPKPTNTPTNTPSPTKKNTPTSVPDINEDQKDDSESQLAAVDELVLGESSEIKEIEPEKEMTPKKQNRLPLVLTVTGGCLILGTFAYLGYKHYKPVKISK